METIFADRPRTDSVVDEARSIGNSVQAARTEQENFAWLEAAGFEAPLSKSPSRSRPIAVIRRGMSCRRWQETKT